MGNLTTHRPGYQHCGALFLVFSTACLLPLVYPAANAISGNETEQLALLEFKAKITADPLGSLTSWNDSNHFCNWFGITVLSVARNNLVGSIPDALGRLKQLAFLELGSNQLSGTVPHSIFNLSTITELYVEKNHLQGYLPSDLFITLPNLQVLLVDVNQFTGSIPTSLSNASNLEWLQLDSNLFTGKVPHLWKLKALNEFGIFNNSLGTRGPDDLNFLCSLTNATDLQILDISINEFGGSLPECIGNLSSNLAGFWLNGNHISGSIPAGIANLVGLTVLQAQNNKISGEVPSLQKLNTLQTLIITLLEKEDLVI